MRNHLHPAPGELANGLVRNAITEIVHPYLRYVEGWQLRASYLRAQLAVHPGGSSEHDLARRRMAQLRLEIEVHRRYLAEEAERLSPDERIDAVIAELDQLLAATRLAPDRGSQSGSTPSRDLHDGPLSA